MSRIKTIFASPLSSVLEKKGRNTLWGPHPLTESVSLVLLDLLTTDDFQTQHLAVQSMKLRQKT